MAKRTYYARGPRPTGYVGTGKYTTKRKLIAKKRRALVRNKTSVPAGLGFPKRMAMTLRYCQTGTMTTGAAGALSTINFRANGLYDPDQTGFGHQPMYFDQIMALYNHYICIGSKITIKWAQTPDSVGSRPPVTVGVFLNDDTVVTPSFFGILENPTIRNRLMTQNAGNAVTTTCKFSAKKVFGGSILADADLQGTVTVNPAEESIYTLFVDSSSSLTACTVAYQVQIDYITIFRELKDIPIST